MLILGVPNVKRLIYVDSDRFLLLLSFDHKSCSLLKSVIKFRVEVLHKIQERPIFVSHVGRCEICPHREVVAVVVDEVWADYRPTSHCHVHVAVGFLSEVNYLF